MKGIVQNEMKHRIRSKHSVIITCAVMLAFSSITVTGCASSQDTEESETDAYIHESSEEQVYEECEELAEGYRDIYEKAGTQLNTYSVQEKIIDYLGTAGYAAVDAQNQIDMVNADQIEEFCENAQANKKGRATILLVTAEGGFVRYDLTTKDGNISVVESYLNWTDGEPRGDGLRSFDAYTWKYTDNGYLFLEEYQPVGYDGAPGQVGFRVKPLDAKCRELNRKYVMPVGFGYNNLLITDWDEANYGALDFYDLYERLYRAESGGSYPYESGYEPMEYEIPKNDFESLMEKYFAINHDTLVQYTAYNEAEQTYHYITRGFADSEFPYGPYPEVVAYKKMDDQTILLTIQAVWIWKERDQALTTELVVRQLEDGSFQYVSNHVIADDGQKRAEWYTSRGAE